MDRVAEVRKFFARLITANCGIAAGSALEAAFAATPREQFVGPPPWKIFTPAGYIEANSSDTGLLYQDVVVSLGVVAPLNNGQPTLHAYCINTLDLKPGQRVLHIGAGTGYYTTILAMLVGESGSVMAYEIEPSLAARAGRNLAALPQVQLLARTGAEGPLPESDAIYVNAGTTEPLAAWLDALRPSGRLLFPLTPSAGMGGMLLVTKLDDGSYSARFLMQVQFVPCVGARNEATAERLTKAFRGRRAEVKTLHRNDVRDESCWCWGDRWWLSSH